MIKTRQQLQGELQSSTTKNPYSSIWHSIRTIIKAEGVLGLQKGLPSALGFQMVMNSVRLGSFQTFDNLGWTRDAQTETISMWRVIVWGGVSGILGSTIGCPFYMVKTQMQSKSHGEFAVGYQHSHKNTIDALLNIYRFQGVKVSHFLRVSE